MAQQKRKNKMKAGTVRKILILIIILALIVVFGMKYLQKRVKAEFGQTDENTVESAEITTGSISTTVTGSGTLSDEEAEEVEIPSSVTLSNIYVEKGDTVKEGDLLATVDSASVLSAMADLQEEIAELDEELADAEEDAASGKVTTAVSGRIKAVYAEEGDDVASVMYENNALMLLSLDGYLAVDVETDDLSEGDETEVRTGDSEYTGTVDRVLKGVATVLISDKSAEPGETAEVSKDGTGIGSGTLYIHESLAVTGYVGTVKAIKTSLNAKVSAGDTLMTLTDTGYSANYSAILNQRGELEEELQELIRIYKEGAIYAPCAGTVTEVTEAGAGTASGNSGSKGSQSTYASMPTGISTGSSTSGSSDAGVIGICPDREMTVSVSVDESNILSLTIGQEAAVYVEALSDGAYTGAVTAVEREGTSSNGVTSYAVEVTLTKAESMLSGMSASVVITIEGVEDALLVPAAAVSKTSSTAYVYTTYDEESGELGGMAEVTLGIINSSYAEIKEGLSEGDTVYYKAAEENNSPFGRGNDFSFGDMPGGFSGGDMPGGFSGGGMPGGFSGGGQSGRPSAR